MIKGFEVTATLFDASPEQLEVQVGADTSMVSEGFRKALLTSLHQALTENSGDHRQTMETVELFELYACNNEVCSWAPDNDTDFAYQINLFTTIKDGLSTKFIDPTDIVDILKHELETIELPDSAST